MIRVGGQDKDGRRLVLLGLEAANVDRLTKGEPIQVDAKELGVDAIIIIDYAATIDAFVKKLREAGVDLPAMEDRR